MSTEIPNELAGIYSAEQYAKQQAYQKENSRLGLFSGGLSFLLIIIMIIIGGFGFLDNAIRTVTENFLWLPLLFFAILMLANKLIDLPFEWYDTFVIEEKFGFNKSTPKLFIADLFKSLLLGAVLGGIILVIILCIYLWTSSWFWLLAWAVITAFSFIMSMFYSEWIVPLFNRQTALEAGELRQSIEHISQKAGFELRNIYVMDGSKRSTKANAYFTGLGKKKRIVLFDTLIQELEQDEIVAVLAHEIGHYKKKHIWQSLIMSTITTGITLFILSLFINSQPIAEALGGNIPSFHLGLIGFSILYTPISEISSLFFNFISRKNEYQADAFAASFGLSEALISGLKKLSVKSLNNLNPHPLVVFYTYSHPTLLQRMEKLKYPTQNFN